MQPLEVRSVFEAAQDPTFLHGLSLINGFSEDVLSTDNNATQREKPVAANGEQRARGVPEISDRMCCSACSQVFDSREEQTEHYRLDWHRFNLKQRLLGRRALAAEEFEEKTRAGDVSSISGSDSNDSDSGDKSDLLPLQGPAESGSGQQSQPLGTRSAKVLFRNSQGQLLSVYRCVLATKKGSSEEAELAESLQSLGADTCWVILLTGGGHFAGAVFRGPQVLEHKTFHRYTVRARRGTAQGLRDAQGQASRPRSAGASLRRYNEAALLKDIQDLLASWAQHLQAAKSIFLRAPRANRALLVGGWDSPLHKDDFRVCHIPFSTRRATFREVLRVHTALATLQVYGKDTAVVDLASSPRKGWKNVPSAQVEEEPPQDTTSTPSEEESQSGELETVEVTLGTLQLQEFEVMPKQSRKRKKGKVGRGARAERPGVHKRPEGSMPQPGAEIVAEPQEGARTELAPWGAGETPLGRLRDALFTACKTGEIGTLRQLLGTAECEAPPGGRDNDAVDPPCPCDHGRMWCEGLEHDHIAPGAAPELLALLNEALDQKGFTLLHVAAAAGKRTAVRLLLEAGANPALRDRQDRPPYCVSADKLTRDTFRKYMADHPAKYDYRRAKVPGPLTPEMEAQRLAKQRAQRAQRKQRAQEQEEKRRFAALSDREKRALAAEQRLAGQRLDTGTTLTSTRRCWQCGESLLGRIPFHYLDFSFCSTGCLQTHRRGRAGPP